MAKFHYDLILGQEIIYRDVPVYDASTLVNGQFLMLDPTAATDCRFINGYTGSSAEMVDGLGTICETLNTTTPADPGDAITTAATTTQRAISSVAATLAQGHRYGKAIINPFAIYLTEYSQATADDVALTGAWSTTTLTLTSLEDDIDGGWVFGTNATTAGFAGQLRYLTAAAAGSCTVDSAPTVAGTTNDNIIKILPIAARLTGLSSDGTKLKSTAAAGAGVSLCIVENYLGGTNVPLEPLRAQRHKGTNVSSSAKFYADVMMLNSLYNPLN